MALKSIFKKTRQPKKYVYSFNEGNKDMRDILGGKGANLAEMVNIGLPVPQGFTVTTEACNKYYEDDLKISEKIILIIQIKSQVEVLSLNGYVSVFIFVFSAL